MANRTSTGLLVPIIVVVGLVAVFGGAKVVSSIEGMFGGHDTVILGSGDTALAVASDAESKVKHCTSVEMVNDRRCGKIKVLVISADRMPFIARNIRLAWGEGKPFMLHRNSPKQAANRAAACGSFAPKYAGGSCDEYACATTDEGGAGARTEEVPLREQRCQGGSITTGYARTGIQQGEEFLVVISRPSSIAKDAFTGQDIAKDQSACES